MANEKQFKVRTKFVATRGVEEYRATIPVWVTEKDVVLEIGCEWGATTVKIAPFCSEVIGTDISRECIERARKAHPNLRFDVLDGFDVLAALELSRQLRRPFTKIYIDMSGISGYRSLLDTISLLHMYATVLKPKAIIVKSGSLKLFAASCVAWQSEKSESGSAMGEDLADDE